MRTPTSTRLAFLLAVLAAPGARAEPLTVTVANAVPDQGAIRAVIFDSAAAMDKGDKPVAALQVRVIGGAATFAFDLPAGRYAVRAYQDLDGDGRMGTNLLGIPSEPYGFSNDAMGTMGQPSFEQAAVAHDAAPRAVTLTLKR
ncbi:MAG TPA: DUF2141 domain-containing protein [Azospirillaceae bacterium]|nr:DUF2141 domain-containing protein [Azospirillaceae bacterium]